MKVCTTNTTTTVKVGGRVSFSFSANIERPYNRFLDSMKGLFFNIFLSSSSILLL